MENLVFKEKFKCIRTLEIEVLSKQKDGSFFIRASTSFFDAKDGGVITQSGSSGFYYNPEEKYFYNKRYKNGDEVIEKIKWSNDVWFVKLILKAIENESLV